MALNRSIAKWGIRGKFSLKFCEALPGFWGGLFLWDSVGAGGEVEVFGSVEDEVTSLHSCRFREEVGRLVTSSSTRCLLRVGDNRKKSLGFRCGTGDPRFRGARGKRIPAGTHLSSEAFTRALQ